MRPAVECPSHSTFPGSSAFWAVATGGSFRGSMQLQMLSGRFADQRGTLDVAHCYVRAPLHIDFRSFPLPLLSVLLLSSKGRWSDPLMPSFRRVLFCNSE